MLPMRWSKEAGQAATESMLVIAVVTIAVVASGYSFVPMFGNGVDALARDVAVILEVGEIGGGGGADYAGERSGNNAGNARMGTDATAFASAAVAAGNDTSGSIPNMTGQPDPRYIPNDMPRMNSAGGDPAPGNDTDPVRNGAFPANRGALGSAAPLAGSNGRSFGAGPGPG